jgi:aminopeptidase-like protein
VLQQSFTGTSLIDRIAAHVLKDADPAHRVGPFRSVVGNDETVWEAPGIEVPMISLSRWPYPQYHTSDDNITIMSREHLDQAVQVLKDIVTVLEDNRTIERRFVGLVALSNPKYDLYIERPDPTVAKHLTERDLRLGRLQDHLPRYFDGTHTIFDIAERFDVPFATLRTYLEKFEEKGLVALHRPKTLGVDGHAGPPAQVGDAWSRV